MRIFPLGVVVIPKVMKVLLVSRNFLMRSNYSNLRTLALVNFSTFQSVDLVCNSSIIYFYVYVSHAILSRRHDFKSIPKHYSFHV